MSTHTGSDDGTDGFTVSDTKLEAADCTRMPPNLRRHRVSIMATASIETVPRPCQTMMTFCDPRQQLDISKTAHIETDIFI